MVSERLTTVVLTAKSTEALLRGLQSGGHGRLVLRLEVHPDGIIEGQSEWRHVYQRSLLVVPPLRVRQEVTLRAEGIVRHLTCDVQMEGTVVRVASCVGVNLKFLNGCSPTLVAQGIIDEGLGAVHPAVGFTVSFIRDARTFGTEPSIEEEELIALYYFHELLRHGAEGIREFMLRYAVGPSAGL